MKKNKTKNNKQTKKYENFFLSIKICEKIKLA